MAATTSQASLLLQKQLKGADRSVLIRRCFLAHFRPRIDGFWGLVCGLVIGADLTKHPVDGFSAGLVDDSNVFEWQVTIIGPPDTL
ncbi:hypothetical protein ABZP36_027120 [Zizania latifolia]